MKFPRYFVIFGLCVLTIQLGMITCVEDDTSDSDSAADSSVSDTSSDTSSDSDSSSDVVDDSSSSSSSDDSANDDVDSGDDSLSSDDDSDATSSDTSSDTATSDDTSSSSDTSSADDATSDDSETEEEEEDIAVGTTLDFDMHTGTAGNGLSASISFEVLEKDDEGNNQIMMICDVSATAGTDAANFWPDEFPADDDDSSSDSDSTSDDSSSSDSDAASDDSSSSSDTASTDGDASVVSSDDSDATSSDTSSDTASSDDTSSSSDTSSSDTSSTDDAASDSDSTSSDDTSDDAVVSSDDTDANTVSDDTDTSSNRATDASCTNMPHLYVIKDTSCCTDPSQSQCAAVEGKKLGCLEATGHVEHTFTDVSWSDFETACLAITDKEVPDGFRSGIRTPKFIASGPSFFRTFGLLNFNSVNFLSSGTKTVTSNAATGAISINFPASSPSTGGTYNPGLFDTLPHIMLPGLTADYLNVIIALLIMSYIAAVILPLFNLGPIFSQLSVPFSRAGDFLSEKMDVLENKVKSSLRKYNRRYHNNVRRVDYDLNYEYDDDYYYYVK